MESGEAGPRRTEIRLLGFDDLGQDLDGLGLLGAWLVSKLAHHTDYGYEVFFNLELLRSSLMAPKNWRGEGLRGDPWCGRQ